MTPAEKMRDKILKEVGMTEEELENLPPEQRAAAEREIAEKLQTLQELQAAQDEPGTLHEHA
jgi:protein-disulfide isomerase-like protein with CxxC motif